MDEESRNQPLGEVPSAVQQGTDMLNTSEDDDLSETEDYDAGFDGPYNPLRYKRTGYEDNGNGSKHDEHSETEDYDARIDSPYNPIRYRCTGYDDIEWEWFDGAPTGSNIFTIDLEGGTMDRYRDIRPYLYYVGFWHELVAAPIGVLNSTLIEEHYVQAGRKYLLQERDMGHGFYVPNQDWSTLNCDRHRTMPFRHFVNQHGNGIVGFEDTHDSARYEDDCVGQVIKTNIRTPLPEREYVKCSPEDPEWDRFIVWMYGPDIHGAFDMVNQGSSVREVHLHRAVQGSLVRSWLSKDMLQRYSNVPQTCPQ